MTHRRRDRSLGDGVYFAAEDYIGFSPRIVILIVDSAVLLVIVWALAFIWLNMFGEYDQLFPWILGLAIWLYVVPLKRSKTRTIGYRMVGARLVTLKGHRPSLMMLTFRSLLWMFGPCNFVFDLIWCGIDDDQQTMRDRFTYMCLVRNGAEPIGTGEVHLAYVNAFGYTLALPHVVHPKTAGP
ncbi:MAG: RDD family protein [Planctomycetota bacterium]